MNLELSELKGEFSIFRFSPEAPVPVLPKGTFYSVTKTEDELSVVAPSHALEAAKVSDGWKCLKVQGPLDFSLVGILDSLTTPLAAAKISLFSISTYDTDYILLRATDWEKAMECLRKFGHQVAQY